VQRGDAETDRAVAIVGAGLAGLAAASRLSEHGIEAVISEKSPDRGGHACSVEYEGFTFDEGPHVSFTADKRIEQLFARGAGSVRRFPLHITNAFDGRFIPHPVQCHLAGLSPDLISACIADLARAHATPGGPPRDYEQWCLASLGRTFAETFTFPYTRKYWTVEPRQMTTEWIGRRMYAPRLIDMIRGALGTNDGAFHYLSEVRYPASGGFQAFVGAFATAPVALHREAIGIRPRQRTVEFADGTSSCYDVLIATVPLPTLVRIIEPACVPEAVREAADHLLCSSLTLVDVALSAIALPDAHIVYVHDERFVSTRIHFPSRLAAANAPTGLHSVQVEVYHSSDKPLPIRRDHLADRIVDELIELAIVARRDDVRFARVRDVPFANVVFTTHRAAAVDTIRRWLESIDILVAGRYGEWAYFWTDDAVRSGWRAADAVASRLHGSGSRRR